MEQAVIRFVLDGRPVKTAPETSICEGCIARHSPSELCRALNRGWQEAGGDDVRECGGKPGHIYVDDPEALVEKDPGDWIIDNPVRAEPAFAGGIGSSEFKDPPMRSGMAPASAYTRVALNPAMVRNTDPQTSKDAAKVVVAGGGKLQDLILQTLQSNGIAAVADGLTGKELAAVLGKPLNSITPRFAQLSRAGLIHANGRRDRQFVWKIGNGVAV